MPYISINIVNPNNEIINYIDNVNYGISKPQLNHLSNLMFGLINLNGNKSISSIAHSILSAKDRSCIYRFLSKSKWDDSIIDRNRIAHLNIFLEKNIKPGSVGFLAIDDTLSDVVTIKDKDYRVFVYEGPVSKFEDAKVIICYEVAGNEFKSSVYLMSTGTELDTKTIISYYLHRWSIETNYKYLKSNLGFDKYRVRSILSIERYFLIVFFAVNFIEIFRVYERTLILETLGDAIRYQNNLSVKEFVFFVHSKTKENVPIDEIYEFLKIA